MTHNNVRALTRAEYDDMLKTEILGRPVKSHHRYKVGDTLKGKDGRDYTVARLIWKQFRWHPIEPAYEYPSNGGNFGTAYDYEFW
jgi:hypothetical protein